MSGVPMVRRRSSSRLSSSKDTMRDSDVEQEPEQEPEQEHEREDVEPPKQRRRKTATAAAATASKASPNEEPDGLAALDEALQSFNAQEHLIRVIEGKDALYAQLQAQFESLKQASFERLDSAAERVSQSMESLEEGAVSAAQHLQNRIHDMEEKDTQQQHVVQQQKDQLDLLRNETLALHNKVRKLEKQLELNNREREMVDETCDSDSSRIIETYQVLTGTRVTVLPKSDEDANVDVFECKSVDRRTKKVVVFHMSFNDEGEVHYLPQRVRFRGASVPDYLNEQVSFDIMETPRFMKNLLASVQKST